MKTLGLFRFRPRTVEVPCRSAQGFAIAIAACALLAACGGGGGPVAASSSAAASDANATAGVNPTSTPVVAAAAPTMTARDAARLGQQATFGPTEALVATIQSQGIAAWLTAQMALSASRYGSGNDGSINQYTGTGSFCDGKAATCWRDWASSEPLLWDFYRNAMVQPDQLRQRVAFALQQIVVVSNVEVNGTYGFRLYYNNLLDNAFGNYRDVLKSVALSPLLGDYLNNADNDKSAPNENFARELMQLFSIGPCALAADGSLPGGRCTPTYDNDVVRAYAYALTGWTYPAGGATPWGCWPAGTNCPYYAGPMVPVAALHDTNPRSLLSGVTVAQGSPPSAALEAVLDSLMAHPNMAPFIGRQLIQHLVSSNPSGAYVARVAAAFSSGRYATFGTGRAGDLAATVAAVLMDREARGDTVLRNGGRLREPVLMFTGVLRALNGKTDGSILSWVWGDALRQHVFRPPSVFNDYPPDFPVAGTALVGPEFGIHNSDATLQRLNFLTYLIDWNGQAPDPTIPNAIGTSIDPSAFVGDADDAAKLVDRLSLLAVGQTLPAGPRARVLDAVGWYDASTDASNWRLDRFRAAAYLVFASPNYQVIR